MTHLLPYHSSYELSITPASMDKKRKGSSEVANQISKATSEPKAKQIHNNKSVTNVIYVIPRDAKSVRLELERLGFFDSRFKLVKVEMNKDGDDKNIVIGLPITQHCKALCLSEGLSPISESQIIGWGEETAPFSSSQMSKLCNRSRS